MYRVFTVHVPETSDNTQEQTRQVLPIQSGVQRKIWKNTGGNKEYQVGESVDNSSSPHSPYPSSTHPSITSSHTSPAHHFLPPSFHASHY